MTEHPQEPAQPSRRGVLRAGALGVAGMTAWTALGNAAGLAAERGPAGEVIPLNTDWLFGGRLTPGSTEPGFDDGGFEHVTLPHCVVDLSWHHWKPSDWEHVWIYRRHFDLPEGLSGSRVFLDFDGVLTGTTPTLNGTELDQHLGGYLPFSYEVTGQLAGSGNVLAVEVDSRWLDVPPSGSPDGTGAVDYLQPGGLYRAVNLRAVPQAFVADVHAQPRHVLDPARRSLEVECTVDAAAAPEGSMRVEVELRDGNRTVSRASAPVELDKAGRVTVTTTLSGLGDVGLWDVDDPRLYDVVATLVAGDKPVHDHRTRTGFREARFETDGFFLNGRRLKLFGLNRHQIFPYRGMAMPARVQRHDAELLRRELNLNAVRTSHYPQSRHFMDACDELGLLVYEEIPGWHYIGGQDWQRLMYRDVEDMVRRDRNRPSVITWGVRINESPKRPKLYSQTKARAKALDDSRPTSGAMHPGQYSTQDWVQEVFSYNNYLRTDGTTAPLRPPLPGVPYFVSEAVGSLAGAPLYRRIDSMEVQRLQADLHAQVHNQAGSDDRYAGLFAWSGIDYASINGGDRIYQNLKWNGVVDTFRVPKLGATIYQAQGDPRQRPVIEPAFYWDFGEKSPSNGPGENAMICSNCDRLEIYVAGEHHASVRPAVDDFPYLPHPPFLTDLTVDGSGKPELRIDGYLDGQRVASRSFSADPSGDRLALTVDDGELLADGSDATRVMFRAVDRHGAPRPYVGGEVTLSLDGPGVLVGDNPFVLDDNGGVGAVWVRTRVRQTGNISVRATHPDLGAATGQVRVRQAPKPPV